MTEEPAPQEELDFEIRSCRNCGKNMTLSKESQQVYCSPECSQDYLRCPVCGKFFPQTQETAPYCSPECGESHPEYDELFKEFT